MNWSADTFSATIKNPLPLGMGSVKLFAYNAKWDADNKIDEDIDKFLKHITDIKPITARQCIKLVPIIAKYKPELKDDIITALHRADLSFYNESMQPLVYKDIQEALKQIQKL